ncbi:LamG domain-containing protein [Carboxylicivirga sp. N1Y90]|uniref:LamG domain-containing protein n=1 Tax=Carboxylicivirga fragile TaxID=3417571 RepID=UPI003D327E98|nr:LamG domain-containing protein [Marinilabiliaceae bacterium N1Y90]
MKTRFNIKFLSYLTAFIMVFAISACEDDKQLGGFDAQSLDALILEANNLLETTEEGVELGLQQPGSKDELREVLTWVDWQIANAESDQDIADAVVRLRTYIDKYKANVVQLAIPLFNNTSGSWIEISENIKPLLADNFTIEIESYFTGSGWIETMFSAGEGDSGGAWGFNLRIFGDRLDLVIGDGGWSESYVTGGNGIKVGDWVHYAVTKSGSVWKVYMNGVEVISETDFPAQTSFNADVPFTLGETPFWPGRAWNGMLRDFRVWSEVRTAEQLIANKDESLDGSEAGLELIFPLNADLGTNFTDLTGDYTAKIVGNGITWAEGGIPPVIELDYTGLNSAIVSATELQGTVVEGTNDGDYPIGTKEYLQSLIDSGNDVVADAKKQDELDGAANSLKAKIKAVNKFLVADANGVLIDRDNADAVGFRITPNYTPQGDYTVEFNVKVKSLLGYGTGEFFNNGNYGVWVYGYSELTEENVLKSGGLWNFTNAGSGWQGPKTDPLVMRTGEWQHVALVHDNTARTTKIFVDGEEKASFEDIGAPVESGWGEMWLGNGWGKMDGYMKDFRLWDVARDAADLDAEIDGTESGLNVYFPLDRVKGVMFNDVTGNYQGEMRGIDWETVE